MNPLYADVRQLSLLLFDTFLEKEGAFQRSFTNSATDHVAMLIFQFILQLLFLIIAKICFLMSSKRKLYPIAYWTIQYLFVSKSNFQKSPFASIANNKSPTVTSLKNRSQPVPILFKDPG